MMSLEDFAKLLRVSVINQEKMTSQMLADQLGGLERKTFQAIIQQVIYTNPYRVHQHARTYSPQSNRSTTMKLRRESPGQKIARLTNIDNQKFLKLEAPYVKTFIEDFKSSIHHTKRSYIKAENYWILAYDQLKFIISLCKKYFDDVLLFGFPENIIDGGDCFAVLYLLPTAPLEVVKASYKCLAGIYHPDKPNGSGDTMSRINTAYTECLEKIKERKVNWEKL